MQFKILLTQKKNTFLLYIHFKVFANDGMPQLICDNCRRNTTMAYNFKTTCKKSDDALKLFLATGALVKPAFTHLNVPIEVCFV